MTCDVCKRDDADVVRELPAGKVCMRCNPFRRCPDCLGVFENRPTPSDMGRQVCGGCGKRRNRRAL